MAYAPVSGDRETLFTQKFIHRQPNIRGDLTEQDWRNIPARMEGDGCPAPIRVPVLAM
jgi:hypothetical protein